MQLSSITDFYILLALHEHAKENAFSRAQVAWLVKLDDHFNILADNFALCLRDYLWLAAIGEARHAKARCCKRVAEIPYVSSRETVYRATAYAPTPENIVVMEEVFDQNWRGSGYGGSKWGDIVRGVKKYTALNAITYIDNVASIAHNGGPAFNKPESVKVLDIDLDIGGENLLRLLEFVKTRDILTDGCDLPYWRVDTRTRQYGVEFSALFSPLNWLKKLSSCHKPLTYKAHTWRTGRLTLVPVYSDSRDDLNDFIIKTCYYCGCASTDKLFVKIDTVTYACKDCADARGLSKCGNCTLYHETVNCIDCNAIVHLKCTGINCTACDNVVCAGCSSDCMRCSSVRLCKTCAKGTLALCSICGYRICKDCQQYTTCGTVVCRKCIIKHAINCYVCRPNYCRQCCVVHASDIARFTCGTCGNSYCDNMPYETCVDCHVRICAQCHHIGCAANECNKIHCVKCYKKTMARTSSYSYVCLGCLGATHQLCVEHNTYTTEVFDCCGKPCCCECDKHKCNKKDCTHTMCSTHCDEHVCSCNKRFCAEHKPKYKSKCDHVFCSASCVIAHYNNDNCEKEASKDVPLCEGCKRVHLKTVTCKVCGKSTQYCKHCDHSASKCSICSYTMCADCYRQGSLRIQGRVAWRGDYVLCSEACYEVARDRIKKSGMMEYYKLPEHKPPVKITETKVDGGTEKVSATEIAIPNALALYAERVAKYVKY